MPKPFSHLRKTAQRAFTLVEAMVAISILSLAITGPMVIAQKGIGSAIYARDQITAFYLAQEAVEYIRNIRDSNRINDAAWLSYLSTCLLGSKCQIDARYTDYTNSEAVKACPAGVCPKLNLDVGATETSPVFYGYGTGGTWRTTPFTRIVEMTETVAGREAVISVTIQWNTNLFSPLRTFSVKEYIFNY